MTQTYEPTGTSSGQEPEPVLLSDAVLSADDSVDYGLYDRIDAVLMRMRRISIRPPLMSMPIPGSPQQVDFAKLLACTTIDRLSEHDDPVTVKVLAAALDLEHSTASRLLTEAEHEGLIRRLPHPDDKRSTVIALTEAGELVCTAFNRARQRFMAGTFADWTPDEINSLATLLDRFVTDVTTGRACWGEWIAEQPPRAADPN